MSRKTPIAKTVASPKYLDAKLDEIQTALGEISWLDYTFARAYTATIDVGGSDVTVPQVYQGASKDYLDMMPNDRWGAYSFFRVDQPQEATLESKYHIRYKADISVIIFVDLNAISTGSADTMNFTDNRDGNTYKAVKIGDQWWMAENLNYAVGGSWCYDNDSDNCDTYGRLYTWDAAINACPTGWHIPSDEEWKVLEGTVDSDYGVGHSEWDGTLWRGTDAGDHLKATSGWDDGGNGTDDYGFSALPGGYRHSNGDFGSMGSYAGFWSSTEYDGSHAWTRELEYGDSDGVFRYSNDKEYGFSVRCVKDEDINTTYDYRYTELLKEDVMLAMAGIGGLTINEVYDEVSECFDAYSKSVDIKYLQTRFGALRFDCTIEYTNECKTDNTY